MFVKYMTLILDDRITGTENVRLKQEFRIQYLKKVHIYQQDLKSPDSLIHI